MRTFCLLSDGFLCPGAAPLDRALPKANLFILGSFERREPTMAQCRLQSARLALLAGLLGALLLAL